MVSASFPSRPFNLRDNVWFIQSDIANNRSLVGWELWVDKRSYSPTYSGGKANRYLTLNGALVHNYTGNGFDFRNGNNFLLASGQTWIGHNADGTGGVSIGAAADFDLLGYTSLSSYISLPTIPRASNVSWAIQDTKYFGTTHRLNTHRASAGFTHTLEYNFGATGWVLMATGVTDFYDWAIPANLIEQIPNASSGNGSIRTTTYNGGTYIGQAVAGMILTAPLDAIPTITDILITEATPTVAANVGAYVKGLSTLALEISGEAGVSGSTITARKIEILSGTTVLQTINTDSDTSAVINASGTVTIRATVTDSRTRTATLTETINVLDYNPPSLNAISVQRALSNGAVDEDEGTYFRVNINAAVQSLINGTQKNTMGYRVSYRAYGGTTWTLKDSGALTGISFNGYKTVGSYSLTQAYEVLVEVYDKFQTSAVIISVAVAAIFMHWDGSTGVGIGKFRENGRVDVAGDVYLKEDTSSGEKGVLIPAPAGHGVITDRLPHSGTTAQRDAYYGSIETSPQQVALANRRVNWYNTDTQWFESFFVGTGSSGLTVPGLVPNATPGWYPLAGSGPKGRLHSSGSQSHTSNTYFTNWMNFGTSNVAGESWRNSTLIDRPVGDAAALRTNLAGRYNLRIWMYFPNGNGTGVWEAGYLDGVASQYPLQKPVVLLSGYGQLDDIQFDDILLFSTGRCYMRTVAATWTVGHGWMNMEYLGPPLVSA